MLRPAFKPDSVPSQAVLELAWDELSTLERELVHQIARFGFAPPSPAYASALEVVARKGFVRAGDFRIANASLEGFARGKSSSVAESEFPTLWETVRGPLGTTVAAVTAAIGYSIPELTVTGVALPTFAVALPVLIRFFAGNPNPRVGT